MAEDKETLSVSDVFEFYVRDDGGVVVTITLDGEMTPLNMSAETAEALGMNFLNVASKAEEKQAKAQGKPYVDTQARTKPVPPTPWGPRRAGKRDDKPN
jgi:hypothetical protein